MSFTGLVRLADSFFHQALGQIDGEEHAGHHHHHHHHSRVDSDGGDTFHPSAGNPAPDAGLFQVKQVSFTAASANIVLVDGAPLQSTVPVEADQVASPSAPNASSTQAQPLAVQTAVPTPVSASTAPANNVVSPRTDDLQSLNTALHTLGLNQTEIGAIDQVAQLIKGFSKDAFDSLVQQLQTLASGVGSQASLSAPSTGFSVQELSIKFAGIDETVQRGSNTLHLTAFRLQVSEVNLTLNNAGTGQTAQIQAPQQANASSSGSSAVNSSTSTAQPVAA